LTGAYSFTAIRIGFYKGNQNLLKKWLKNK